MPRIERGFHWNRWDKAICLAIETLWQKVVAVWRSFYKSFEPRGPSLPTGSEPRGNVVVVRLPVRMKGTCAVGR